MQVENLTDNNKNPSMPTRSTPLSTMFSNPHVQQPSQSGDDVFGGALMQVEDLADNTENPSMPMRSTPPSTMFSNPHAQQPLQSGDDIFGGVPMQVEDPADNTENPSTPTRPTLPRPTPPSTQSTICISEQKIQGMCEDLELFSHIMKTGDGARIKRSLHMVFAIVCDALEEDPNLKARLANKAQFIENVEKEGEQQFFNLLRDIAKKGSWRELLQNSTSFSYFNLKCSDRVLSPDVFLNSNFAEPTKPKWRLSSASEIGARLS
jgi:hypothetical protein